MSWFETFWAEKIDDRADDLGKVRNRWHGWKLGLPPRQRARLEATISGLGEDDQRGFVELLTRRFEKRFDRWGKDTAWFVLHQLSDQDGFSAWKTTLRAYQRASLDGVKCVTLGGRGLALVVPIRVLFVHGPPSARFLPYQTRLDEGIGDVYEAVRRLLGGGGFWLFVAARFLAGPRVPRLIQTAYAVAGVGLLAMLACTMWPWLAGQITTLTYLVPVSLGAAALFCAPAVWREHRVARDAGRRLREAAPRLLFGHPDPRSNFYIACGSYGLGLYISALTTLFEGREGESELARRSTRLAATRGVAWSAAIDDRGRLGSIDPKTVTAKVRVCAARGIDELRLRARLSGSPAAGKTRLRFLPRWPPLILATCDWGPRRWGRGIACVAAILLLLTGAAEALRFSLPRRPPELRQSSSVVRVVDEERDELRLDFAEADEDDFAVRLQSGYWINRVSEISRDSEGLGMAVLALDPRAVRTADRPDDGVLEIVQRRSYLGRRLPSVVVSRMTLGAVMGARRSVTLAPAADAE